MSYRLFNHLLQEKYLILSGDVLQPFMPVRVGPGRARQGMPGPGNPRAPGHGGHRPAEPRGGGHEGRWACSLFF